MKKILLSLFVASAALFAQAEEVSLLVKDATDIQGTLVPEKGTTKEHYQPVTSFKIQDYTFSCDTVKIEGSVQNKPALYHLNATATLRLYTANTVTISAPADMNMATVTLVTPSCKGVSDNNLPSCSAGGTFAIEKGKIVWMRPETEQIINEITISLPTGKDGNTNPNVQVSEIIISTSATVIEPAKKVAFVPATEVKTGKCLLVAGGGYAVAGAGNYGYLNIAEAAVEGGEINVEADNAFTISAVEGGYTIQQSDGRYLYMKGDYNSFNFSNDANVEGSVWTITFDETGKCMIVNALKEKTIMFSTEHKSFGAYPESADDRILPELYVEKSTAIDMIEIENANAPVEYYNLQGVRVAGDQLSNGIYVRRQGKQVSKVLVK